MTRRPVVRIDAAEPAAGTRIVELMQYRDLLLILAARDLQVRYRQAAIGICWALLRPAATVAMFVLLFGLLGKAPSVEGVPYAAVALCGFIVWQLFSVVVADQTDSLLKNRHVITKVYFPRVLIPIGATTTGLVDFAVALLPAIGILMWLGVWPTWRLALLPVWIAGVLLLAMTAGMVLAALNARYRDVGYLVPFLLQIGLFLCPVIYSTTFLIPEGWRGIYALNPLATLIESVRWSLLGAPLPTPLAITFAGVVSVVGFRMAWALFHRLDQELVEGV